jgi:hypothetical protein
MMKISQDKIVSTFLSGVNVFSEFSYLFAIQLILYNKYYIKLKAGSHVLKL